MYESEVIQEVNRMEPLEKLKVYIDYFVDQIATNYNFHVLDETESQRGWSKADKQHLGLQFRWIWKDHKPDTFESFCSPANVRIINNGKNWKERGYAQEIRTDLFGIYNWYQKTPYVNKP